MRYGWCAITPCCSVRGDAHFPHQMDDGKREHITKRCKERHTLHTTIKSLYEVQHGHSYSTCLSAKVLTFRFVCKIWTDHLGSQSKFNLCNGLLAWPLIVWWESFNRSISQVTCMWVNYDSIPSRWLKQLPNLLSITPSLRHNLTLDLGLSDWWQMVGLE